MPTMSRRSFLFMTLALAACKRGAADLFLNGQTMGTTYSIVAVNAPNVSQAQLQAAVTQALADIDAKMSNWSPISEVSAINALAAGGSQPLSADMHTVLQAARDVYGATEGQFDITLGPLIDLWGFGASAPTGAVPPEQQVAQAQGLAGLTRALTWTDSQVTKNLNGAGIYLSAIGKGFGVDRVGATLRHLGITDYMVEIGGDILASGRNAEGNPWQIAVETPDALQRGIEQIVGISNVGLATSGDYRNFFEEDGKRYCHILDSQTGRPIIHDTASVTVVAENAMLADAWATALLALGVKRGMEIANAHQISALFIDRNTTSGHTKFVPQASATFDAAHFG